MLEPAIKYKDQIDTLQYNIWFNDKYKYWNCGVYYGSFQIDENTWCKHQFVSIIKDKVIGYIEYSVDREENNVHSLNIVNFSDNKALFGRDLRQALRDIFEKYNFRKLSFNVIVGNPIEKSYDKMILKYGGRVVGVRKDEVKLIDGKYYDEKLYEILASEYFDAINKD